LKEKNDEKTRKYDEWVDKYAMDTVRYLRKNYGKFK